MTRRMFALLTIGWGLAMPAALAAQMANVPDDRGPPVRHPPSDMPPRIQRLPNGHLPVPPAILVTPDAALSPQRSTDQRGHRAACARRYRSYDPRTDLYAAAPGVRRRCPL